MPADNLRTMAVRVGDDVHTKMTALAQIQGISLNDALTAAVNRYLEETARDPKVVAKVEELQRAAEARYAAERDALSSLRSTITGSPASGKNAPREAKPGASS